ncbi:uncharacterized protein LOC100863480 [Apis florea]|uniref:uncharacterized protein LOC100863480 n=1 Tax=Apis florea TaxID=7463 RepID=UPI0012FEDB51|nr:uncharacterized protein LOC100863480 [Apis florea]
MIPLAEVSIHDYCWAQTLGAIVTRGGSLPREGTSACWKSDLSRSGLQLPGTSHRLEVLPVPLLCMTLNYALPEYRCNNQVFNLEFWIARLICISIRKKVSNFVR